MSPLKCIQFLLKRLWDYPNLKVELRTIIIASLYTICNTVLRLKTTDCNVTFLLELIIFFIIKQVVCDIVLHKQIILKNYEIICYDVVRNVVSNALFHSNMYINCDLNSFRYCNRIESILKYFELYEYFFLTNEIMCCYKFSMLNSNVLIMKWPHI